MRVVIADDSVLFREGVPASSPRPDSRSCRPASRPRSKLVIRATPDVAIVDVRMPPTHTDEGTRAAGEIRARHPEVGVLVLSQVVEARTH